MKTLKAMTIFRICVGVVFVLGLASFCTIGWYNQHQIRQKYLAMGIYEVGDTFTYVKINNSVFAYFMICEPPSGREELVQTVLKYIEEHSIAQELMGRFPDLKLDSDSMAFVAPSKDFPIGWNDGDATGFLGGSNLQRYISIIVRIPSDAKTQDDFTISVVVNGNSETVNQ